MRSILFSLILLFPAVCLSFPIVLTWDDNPASDEVTHYNIYKNDIFESKSILNEYASDGIAKDCFSLGAVNFVGEGGKVKACIPMALPGKASVFTLTYTDSQGNLRTITVPLEGM